MDINAKQLDQTTVVSVIGSVDALTAGEVNSFLRAQIVGGHTHIVADLSQVDFMSSAGLRAILATLKESRQPGGDLRLAAAQPGVDKILKMSGFTSILKVSHGGRSGRQFQCVGARGKEVCNHKGTKVATNVCDGST